MQAYFCPYSWPLWRVLNSSYRFSFSRKHVILGETSEVYMRNPRKEKKVAPFIIALFFFRSIIPEINKRSRSCGGWRVSTWASISHVNLLILPSPLRCDTTSTGKCCPSGRKTSWNPLLKLLLFTHAERRPSARKLTFLVGLLTCPQKPLLSFRISSTDPLERKALI